MQQSNITAKVKNLLIETKKIFLELFMTRFWYSRTQHNFDLSIVRDNFLVVIDDVHKCLQFK